MKSYFEYIKSFSTKKKIFCSLSFLAFLYELFVAIALIFTYCGLEDAFRANSIYSVLETPIIACAYFPPIAVYFLLFPIMYIVTNWVFLHKREFDVSIVTFNFVSQLIHPATFVWFIIFLAAILNAFGVFDF